jgi:anthranilate phosphoribosyltransferase
MAADTHPFARFVRILGRGKTLSRSLTEGEAEEAMGMILQNKATPEQLGAFLMLLRVKEESAEEIAGFTRAVRATFSPPEPMPAVDIDWPSYAGKRRQLPWYLICALLLARNGVRIFMHGSEGHTPGRTYTRDVLESLGVPIALDFEQATQQLQTSNFAYMPLECLNEKLRELIDLRPMLGLRSPVHTVSRMLNPLAAACSLQGIFHPGYMEIHRDAAKLLGERQVVVFRGDGGESERRPHKPCDVWSVHNGVASTGLWPPCVPEPRQVDDTVMDIAHLETLWCGEEENAYGEAAVLATLAVILRALGHASSREKAHAAAMDMWQARDKRALLVDF